MGVSEVDERFPDRASEKNKLQLQTKRGGRGGGMNPKGGRGRGLRTEFG